MRGFKKNLRSHSCLIGFLPACSTKAPSVSRLETIKTEFTASKAGEGTVNADLTFFLCTDEVCKRYKAAAACGFKAK